MSTLVRTSERHSCVPRPLTRAWLKADPKTEDLAADIRTLIGRCVEVRTGQFAAWEQEIVAQARVDNCDVSLDETVDEVANEVDRAVRSDRGSP